MLGEWKSLIESRDPARWIDQHIHRNELNQPFALYPHQREGLRLAFDFDTDGRLPRDTILYSAVKKSGKTSMLALLALYWAMTQEAPNEITLLANDLEQTQARVYASIQKLLRYNPELDPGATVNGKEIRLSNDSVIKPMASEYAGASGSNHGFVGLDELWAYTLERSRRLYEELISVPTRLNSIKVVTTYAGFENESKLFGDLYRLGVGTDEHDAGQGESLHPDLPIYGHREARIFTYWDHQPRFPWQTPATTPHKSGCCDRVPICAFMKIAGPPAKRSSLLLRCGILAWIRCTGRCCRLGKVDSSSVSMARLSTIWPRW
jgi:hypothetical protein